MEDGYLLLLQDNTKLMILSGEQTWQPCFFPLDETDRPTTYNAVKVIQKLWRSPGSISLIGEEELQVVSALGSAPSNIGIPQSQVEYLIEVCQSELDKRTRIKDALDLVELYQRAKQSSSEIDP